MAIKYLDTTRPNDPTAPDLTLPGYAHKRGKILPAPHRVANGHGGMGQGVNDKRLDDMNARGRRLLDEALK